MMSSVNENRHLLASLCRRGGEGPLQTGEAGITVCDERKDPHIFMKQLMRLQVTVRHGRRRFGVEWRRDTRDLLGRVLPSLASKKTSG